MTDETNEDCAATNRRRMGICEEKSSGIDKVVTTIEMYQLPAPAFTVRHQRTVVIIYGSRPFDEMLRDARIRACYQHAALKYVMSQPMTNRSLRERFGLSETKSASISQVIAATIDEKLIKADETAGDSRCVARYLPFWA
jgi:ATP-dependent DNA helicase RecG